MKSLNKLFLAGAIFALSALNLQAFNFCDAGFYIAGSGAISFHNDHDFKTATTHECRDYDFGYAYTAALGLDLCPFRIELEGRFQRYGLDKVLIDHVKHGDVIGSTRDVALMLNVFFDIPVCDFISFYIGGGAGYAYSKLQFSTQNKIPRSAPTSNTDEGFAWQGMAGISYPLTECSELYIGYRIFGTDKYSNEACIEMEDIPISHSGEVGVRYYF